MMLFPKCHRGRTDCEPIDCIDTGACFGGELTFV